MGEDEAALPGQAHRSGTQRRDNRWFLEAPAWAGRKRGTQSQALGRSKGGMTTKIVALTGALGNLVRFVLLPGQRCDIIGVPPLIENLAFDGLIADKLSIPTPLRPS